ncbi:pancreatic secretory granule membrane major glycoprotein GP2-like [Hypanus sabinus]|uniref:pancreatic secretory granule membrane major glycoprotein GP2-like n=1 Tax=Hypanus sabinus TaxID=79690 RepID=UPI0028C3CAC7|nr:pancreatic secretory granule membrane major glycoprotein GP2-like [Hypanus sabinus]
MKNCSGYFVYRLWPTAWSNAVFCTEPLSDTTQERQGSVTGEPGPGLTTSPAGSVSSVTDSALGDPCGTRTILDQPWRSTDCSHTECTHGQWMSDGHLEVGWYRFNSSGGWKIPETVVPQYHCSGVYPGWLNGPHPSVGEGEVTRTVCFTVSENTCYWRREIGLKNCSGYFVYRLWPTPVGTAVYCTDLEFSTLEQSTGLTTTEHTQELSSVPAGDTSSDLEASTMDQSNGSSTGQPTASPSSTSAGERSSGVRMWINVQLTSSGNVSEDEVWKAIRRKLQEMFGDPNLQIKLARFRAEPPEE